MNILIVSGGKLNMDFAKAYLTENRDGYDRIIAADKGLAYCHELDLMPTDILGDFDSIGEDNDLVSRYEENGVPVNRFPSRKDFTDTELAVQMALAMIGQETADHKTKGDDHVTMLACTGTRYDHSLGNIGLLELFCRAGIDAVIVDEHNEIRMASAEGEKTAVILRNDGKGENYYSLIPWGGDVIGVYLYGMEYPLTDHTLRASESIGISNEIVEETGMIEFSSGKLLVIKAKD